MSASNQHSTSRADVLAEEYKGTYLWAELDKARARIADLEEQLEAVTRERDELRTGLGTLEWMANPTSGERVATGLPSRTSSTEGANQSPEDSSPAKALGG